MELGTDHVARRKPNHAIEHAILVPSAYILSPPVRALKRWQGQFATLGAA